MYLINSNLNFHFSLSISDAAFEHVAGSGVKQYFRVHPQNLQVLEGTEALLRCEIGNLGGSVQWAKDGFALGKMRWQHDITNSVYIIKIVSSTQVFQRKFQAIHVTQ